MGFIVSKPFWIFIYFLFLQGPLEARMHNSCNITSFSIVYFVILICIIIQQYTPLYELCVCTVFCHSTVKIDKIVE